MRYFVALSIFLYSMSAYCFCGFYVAKADSKLFNEASQVVLVRDEDKTVLTMVNDYKGEMKEFALVVPVPTVLEKDQIYVAEKKVVERLDAFTAPRLVEYFDHDPCAPPRHYGRTTAKSGRISLDSASPEKSAAALGVKIEAQYTVGEYDILILSAKESGGLVSWLKENQYRIPENAEKVLSSYINQNLKFFVAKVNLKEQSQTGFSYLRPIQIAYESKRFMLPIRLGTVNANGPQDLIIMTLTKKGRVEATNYRTVKIPTGQNIPPYVKSDFGSAYKAIFAQQVKKEDMKAVFLEYAWDMSWCDPCAAEPLSPGELKDLGVFWLNLGTGSGTGPNNWKRFGSGTGGAVNAFVTRLHVRYDAKNFPDDLMFQETSNRENFQGRYVLQHPFEGALSCEQGETYKKGLKSRQDQEAIMLATLTGWNVNDIRKKMGNEVVSTDDKSEKKEKWWKNLWDEEKKNSN